MADEEDPRPGPPWRDLFRAAVGGRSEETVRELLDAVPEGLALLDASGLILHANPALRRMAGAVMPPRRGLPATDLLAPEGRAALTARLAAAAGGEAEGPPVTASPADPGLAEAQVEWALACRPLPAAARRGGAAVLLHVADRTERRRAAARLADAARLETVGRLAGGIAHDFNNLLAAVLGAAGALRDAGALAPAAEEDLRTIEDAARRGAGLVRQLLAFARQQHLEPRVLDLNAAVRAMAPLLRRLLGGGGAVRLDLALEEPGWHVRVDPGQLDQVVLNLAANAREAMPEGGVLRIATRGAVVLGQAGDGRRGIPPGRYVVLEVSDTGRGIPPEVLPRLFEPFYTTRPERGGTGLGLATVQGIIAQSGGHIGVRSRPGEGTCFTIHLPRHQDAASPWAEARDAVAPAGDGPAPPALAPPPAEPPSAGPLAAAPGTIQVLLVEDEAPLRRLAERVLQRAGYAVAAADSTEAALDGLEAGQIAPPALLVSDVAMAGADGLALARGLRARWPGLPVVLMSGYSEVTLGQDLEAEGIRLLKKPFAPAALVAAAAAALRPARQDAASADVVY